MSLAFYRNKIENKIFRATFVVYRWISRKENSGWQDHKLRAINEFRRTGPENPRENLSFGFKILDMEDVWGFGCTCRVGT